MKILTSIQILTKITFDDRIGFEYDVNGNYADFVQINERTKARQEKIALLGVYFSKRMN